MILFLAGYFHFVLVKSNNSNYNSLDLADIINKDTHQVDGFGFDAIRTDNQATFLMSNEKADEVYEYLVNKYTKDEIFLKNNFSLSGLSVSKSNEQFTDEYYDTPKLDILKMQNSIRHRLRENLENADDEKNGRELVQVKISPDQKFANLRIELKFPIQYPNNSTQNINSLPLVNIIEKGVSREQFKEVVEDMGANPYSLKHTLTLNQHRRRVYINQGNDNILTISLDVIDSHFWWAKTKFSQIDFGLSEIAYTEANKEKRQEMQNLRTVIKDDLFNQFPELQIATMPKYQRAFSELSKQILFLNWLIKLI